jgi:hypothetical protein
MFTKEKKLLLRNMPLSELASPVLNVLLVAFVCLCLEQIMHEAAHGLAAVSLGARWEKLYLWAADWNWPDGGVRGEVWRTGAIEASGAAVNLITAFVCILLFGQIDSELRLFRLFLFFLGAYSLFSAFGYLLFDPIFARPESAGDVAKIVMLLGGGWIARLPLILIGAAGTIYGYFWMGQAAMRFTLGATSSPDSKVKVGLILCVLPYLTNNLIFSFLAWYHPLGTRGFVAAILKLWFGFLGFVLAFMINFIWQQPKAAYPNETLIPQKLSLTWSVAALVFLVLILVLLPGVTVQRLRR